MPRFPQALQIFVSSERRFGLPLASRSVKLIKENWWKDMKSRSSWHLGCCRCPSGILFNCPSFSHETLKAFAQCHYVPGHLTSCATALAQLPSALATLQRPTYRIGVVAEIGTDELIFTPCLTKTDLKTWLSKFKFQAVCFLLGCRYCLRPFTFYYCCEMFWKPRDEENVQKVWLNFDVDSSKSFQHRCEAVKPPREIAPKTWKSVKQP